MWASQLTQRDEFVPYKDFDTVTRYIALFRFADIDDVSTHVRILTNAIVQCQSPWDTVLYVSQVPPLTSSDQMLFCGNDVDQYIYRLLSGSDAPPHTLFIFNKPFSVSDITAVSLLLRQHNRLNADVWVCNMNIPLPTGVFYRYIIINTGQWMETIAEFVASIVMYLENKSSLLTMATILQYIDLHIITKMLVLDTKYNVLKSWNKVQSTTNWQEESKIYCPICSTLKTQSMVSLQCGHCMCAECRQKLLKQECPFCKRAITHNIRLYL